MKNLRHLSFPVALFVPFAMVAGCTTSKSEQAPPAEQATQELQTTQEAKPSAAEAEAYTTRVNAELKELWADSSRANWIKENFITDDTDALAADADEKVMAYSARAIKEAARFNDVEGKKPEVERMLKLLRVSSSLPAPDDEQKRTELAQTASELTSKYGRGSWCPEGKSEGDSACKSLGDFEDIIGDMKRTPAERKDAWVRWRSISPAMRPLYERLVVLGNQGASEIGFANLSDLWKSRYDMTTEAFETDTEKLWGQVKPLYEDLHCYVRGRLSKKYGKDVKDEGTLPAHLLGNMWSQDWSNIYPLVEPYQVRTSVDVTKALNKAKKKPMDLVNMGENFFTSLGLDPLPETFYKRSLFVKPEDREVVCHASAWDVSLENDVRIKMCIKVDEDNLITVHHELGHIYYYMNYYKLPALYQSGANDGFHEAIGDAIALSITPQYLKDQGILKKIPNDDKGLINEQMRMALSKVAFLPFGKMIDQWRWDVFSGKVQPAEYNAAWWKLRGAYQGIHAPIERSEADFDPGAKFHIPANVPYMRYFLAHILQFQFHRSLCEAAGHKGPLHTCSIYGSKEAGAKLQALLALGASQPWQDALEAMTGSREMDATAILDYFAPLQAWLKKQNEGKTCGW